MLYMIFFVHVISIPNIMKYGDDFFKQLKPSLDMNWYDI